LWKQHCLLCQTTVTTNVATSLDLIIYGEWQSAECRPVRQLSVHWIQAATGREWCHREQVMNDARNAHHCNWLHHRLTTASHTHTPTAITARVLGAKTDACSYFSVLYWTNVWYDSNQCDHITASLSSSVASYGQGTPHNFFQTVVVSRLYVT